MHHLVVQFSTFQFVAKNSVSLKFCLNFDGGLLNKFQSIKDLKQIVDCFSHMFQITLTGINIKYFHLLISRLFEFRLNFKLRNFRFAAFLQQCLIRQIKEQCIVRTKLCNLYIYIYTRQTIDAFNDAIQNASGIKKYTLQ